MNAIQFIQLSLEMSKNWVLGLAADAQDAPLTRPTPNGGNHPLWCLGHLAYAEGNLVHKYIKGEANPLADWAELFDAGTQPSDDASLYPSKAEGEMQEWFGTIGQCLAAIPIHFGFHGGQIADARRAAGKPLLMG